MGNTIKKFIGSSAQAIWVVVTRPLAALLRQPRFLFSGRSVEAIPAAVVQKPDYSVLGVDEFYKTVDKGMNALLANAHVADCLPAVLAESEKLGEKDLPVFELLKQRRFAEWDKACAGLIATTLPVGAGLSKEAQFHGLISAYQGKYAIPELCGLNGKKLLIKKASRVGSEQLLRRLFVIDGQVVFNPFGGFFLAKIQELPYVVKFWLVLRNIVEAVPAIKACDDVTINYFTQLLVVKSAGGKNLYDGLQEATQELWGCRFQAEAMELDKKLSQEDKARLQECVEEVVLAHPYEVSLDDFGPSHLAWASESLQSMKLKEVKMSAEMKAKIVDQMLADGKSSLLVDWIEKVGKVGDFQYLVLEGSDNCAGMHPGVIFTDETRANVSLNWTAQLQKYTQDQVEDAHADVVEKIQSTFPGKPVRIQGGFGVLEKEVDGALASLCAQLGQTNVASTFGSSAWLTWAKGKTRSSEMGLADQK